VDSYFYFQRLQNMRIYDFISYHDMKLDMSVKLSTSSMGFNAPFLVIFVTDTVYRQWHIKRV